MSHFFLLFVLKGTYHYGPVKINSIKHTVTFPGESGLTAWGRNPKVIVLLAKQGLWSIKSLFFDFSLNNVPPFYYYYFCPALHVYCMQTLFLFHLAIINFFCFCIRLGPSQPDSFTTLFIGFSNFNPVHKINMCTYAYICMYVYIYITASYLLADMHALVHTSPFQMGTQRKRKSLCTTDWTCMRLAATTNPTVNINDSTYYVIRWLTFGDANAYVGLHGSEWHTCKDPSPGPCNSDCVCMRVFWCQVLVERSPGTPVSFFIAFSAKRYVAKVPQSTLTRLLLPTCHCFVSTPRPTLSFATRDRLRILAYHHQKRKGDKIKNKKREVQTAIKNKNIYIMRSHLQSPRSTISSSKCCPNLSSLFFFFFSLSTY